MSSGVFTFIWLTKGDEVGYVWKPSVRHIASTTLAGGGPRDSDDRYAYYLSRGIGLGYTGLSRRD